MHQHWLPRPMNGRTRVQVYIPVSGRTDQGTRVVAHALQPKGVADTMRSDVLSHASVERTHGNTPEGVTEIILTASPRLPWVVNTSVAIFMVQSCG